MYAVCLSNARQVPVRLATPAAEGQPGSSSSTSRALLAGDASHHSHGQRQQASARKSVRIAQAGEAPPPFVGADVPRGPRTEPLQTGPGFGGGGFGGGGFGGGGFGGGAPGWIGYAGISVNALSYGLGATGALFGPLVNGVASNIPLMVPALPDDTCLKGQPIFIPQANRVMCIVGSGADVTNFLGRAANVLVGTVGAGVGIASQIASIAGR
jgi:hypothetical protein